MESWEGFRWKFWRNFVLEFANRVYRLQDCNGNVVSLCPSFGNTVNDKVTAIIYVLCLTRRVKKSSPATNFKITNVHSSGQKLPANLLVRTKLLLSLHYQVSRLLSIVPALASLVRAGERTLSVNSWHALGNIENPLDTSKDSPHRDTYTVILPEFGWLPRSNCYNSLYYR